ncbi:MAG TPA: AraC family transcriptional regulator [Polyangiaceae bacterium]|nr:AraC family transcriptional regulator [Polyangiaceae bacterium]
MWPFLRIINSSPSPLTTQILGSAGISPVDLARPDTRLPHRLVMSILEAWVEHTGDESIGLRAGASVEPGDFDAMEYAARSCATLREALECASRYMHLVNEAADVSIVDLGGDALWRYRITDGVPQPRAANDFVIASAAAFSMRCAKIDRMPLEVHFMHDAPADPGAYAAFSASIVRFGMPHNGYVMEKCVLDGPTRVGNVRMHAAFEKYARELSERAALGVRSRARDAIVARLGSGDMCMESVAASLAMSVPTLRRRLEDEGTTFTDLVDDVRRDLAERYLRDPARSISEIAALLGFAHAPAFHKAFRRWKGVTPTAHRARS